MTMETRGQLTADGPSLVIDSDGLVRRGDAMFTGCRDSFIEHMRLSHRNPYQVIPRTFGVFVSFDNGTIIRLTISRMRVNGHEEVSSHANAEANKRFAELLRLGVERVDIPSVSGYDLALDCGGTIVQLAIAEIAISKAPDA